MSKELVVSATPHETRVAILEDGQLCEIYVEREKEFALVGSIYKGRVTRVLPGMQSAFVDIGLDSDAFLYVSDFLENLEEYDHIVTSVEEKVQKMEAQGGQVFMPAATPTGAVEPPEVAAAPVEAFPGTSGNGADAAPPAVESSPRDVTSAFQRPSQPSRFDRGGFDRGRDRGGRGRRGRGRGRDRDRRPSFGHGRELPPSKFAPHRPYEPPPADEEPILLPGESLAKYRGRVPAVPAAPTEQAPFTVEERPAGPAETVTVAPPEETPPPEVTEIAAAEAAAPQLTELGITPGLPEPAPMTAHETEPPGAVELPEPPVAESPAETPVTLATSPSEAELTPEEATNLAEQLADVQQEEREEEEAEAQEEQEEIEASETAEEEFTASVEELVDAEEAAAEAAEAEETVIEEPAAEEFPARTARVEHRGRPRFQRPMRRGRRGGPPPRHRARHQAQRRPLQQISELLKPGQEIIVQIAKEPLGKKGARITSHVALPGRYLVYMPTVDHIGVSRKIALPENRSRLRRLVMEAKGTFPGGFIVRTAAENATDDEIRTDIQYLGKTWTDLLQRSEQRKAPSLLHRDLNLIERILRDHLGPDYSAIWVDSEEEFTKVVEFVNRFQPALVNRVKLYTKPTPIFEEFGIQQEIDKALRPKVWLKSGGYIVINHTEALVAIDINTGKFVGRGSTRLEDTIVKTNLEAVKEIVRQIRLRDLGGIIVIDFIDMEERKNRQKVMQALDEALRADKAPSKVLAFNEFGLVAITRKRTKQALERTLCQPCPYCTGSGMVKSIPTLCYEIQTEARKMAQDLDGQSLTLRVNPEIAKALKTRESSLVEELEQWTHKSVIIQSDPTLHWEQYDIY